MYSGGTLEVRWNANTNTPAKLTGALSQPSKHSPEWISYEFLNRWKSIYGLQKPNRDLKVIGVERFENRVAVHFSHLLFKTPVWEDRLVVEMNEEGVIVLVEGTIHSHLEKQLFNRPMHPAITRKQALNRAIASHNDELTNEPQVDIYYLSTRPGIPLIYVVTLESRMSDKRTVTFVHSLTGRIIDLNGR